MATTITCKLELAISEIVQVPPFRRSSSYQQAHLSRFQSTATDGIQQSSLVKSTTTLSVLPSSVKAGSERLSEVDPTAKVGDGIKSVEAKEDEVKARKERRRIAAYMLLVGCSGCDEAALQHLLRTKVLEVYFSL